MAGHTRATGPAEEELGGTLIVCRARHHRVILEKAQKAHELCNDQYAWDCEYLPGQKVLLLMPSFVGKRVDDMANTTILRKMGPVTYCTSTPHR